MNQKRQPKRYGLYIGGKWIPSKNGESFESINPATLEIIGEFAKADVDDVLAAVDAADEAQNKWSEIPAPRRANILFKVAQLLHAKKEELARIVTLEMGKPLAESMADVQEAIDCAEYFAGEGRRLFGNTTPSELRDKWCLTIRRPIGTVGCITPWNFPIAIPSWKIMPALIAGNAVLFKPSSDTPLCAAELVRVFEQAGLPPGVLNLVTGPADVVGKEIVTNKNVRCISFTGHRDTGAWILANAGIKRVGLELGSKNAIIVMDDADLRLAIDGCIWGAFATTGQRCTAASRIIVHEKIKKQFESEFVKRTQEMKIGNGLDEKIQLGPLVNKAALEKVEHYVDIGNKEGAKKICGGKQAKVGLPGYFYEPTIFTDVTKDMTIAKDEIFGPFASIIYVSNFMDAIEVANSVDYGLSSAIYTKSISSALKAAELLEAGITYINSPTIGAEIHLPFGGLKHSGQTREGGIVGIDEFTELKTIYIDFSGRLQRAQID